MRRYFSRSKSLILLLTARNTFPPMNKRLGKRRDHGNFEQESRAMDNPTPPMVLKVKLSSRRLHYMETVLINLRSRVAICFTKKTECVIPGVLGLLGLDPVPKHVCQKVCVFHRYDGCTEDCFNDLLGKLFHLNSISLHYCLSCWF